MPLAFKVHRGAAVASQVESVSMGGVNASYLPIEQRPPNRDVAAKAVAALTIQEKTFGARTVKAGLRLGMLKVADIEVQLSNGQKM